MTEDHRHKGIGRALMQHCVDLVRQRGWSKVIWGANAVNVEGQKFYEHLNAQEITGARWFYIPA